MIKMTKMKPDAICFFVKKSFKTFKIEISQFYD